jgi:hypothetical protein
MAFTVILTSLPVAAQGDWVEGFVALPLCPTLVEAHGLEMPLLTFLFACGVVGAMRPGGRRPARPVAGSGGPIFRSLGFCLMVPVHRLRMRAWAWKTWIHMCRWSALHTS